MELVVSLQDDANGPLNSDALPMLPAQLVKFHTGMFIREVQDLFRTHISKFWPVEKIYLIEDEHHDLFKVYNSDPILKATIDK